MGYHASGTKDCDAYIDSVGHDYNTQIYVGGRTLDAKRVYGWPTTALNCFSAGNYAAYFSKYTSGTLTWEKYMLGVYGLSPEGIIKVPWIGISQETTMYSTNFYDNFVGVIIHRHSGWYVMFLSGADGSVASFSKLSVTEGATYSFSGYDYAKDLPQLDHYFKF